MPGTDYARVSTDPELAALLREAVSGVDAGEGSILLLTDDGRGLRFALSDSPVAEALAGSVQPLNRGITGLAFTMQQPMVVNDTSHDGSFDPAVQERTGVRTGSVMAVPLVTPEREYGALTAVNSRRSGGFSGDDLMRYCQSAQRIISRLAALHQPAISP